MAQVSYRDTDKRRRQAAHEQLWGLSYEAVPLGLLLLNKGRFIMFQYTAQAVCNPPTHHNCLPLNQDWILGQLLTCKVCTQTLPFLCLYSVFLVL